MVFGRIVLNMALAVRCEAASAESILFGKYCDLLYKFQRLAHC